MLASSIACLLARLFACLLACFLALRLSLLPCVFAYWLVSLASFLLCFFFSLGFQCFFLGGFRLFAFLSFVSVFMVFCFCFLFLTAGEQTRPRWMTGAAPRNDWPPGRRSAISWQRRRRSPRYRVTHNSKTLLEPQSRLGDKLLEI